MEDGTEQAEAKPMDDGAVVAPDFGSCCDELKEALAAEGFEPYVTIGEDGLLYLSVGEVVVDADQRGYVDHPIFFCPFCGTKLQDREEVMARLNTEDTAAITSGEEETATEAAKDGS